jgi:hypothetical protein
MYDLRHWRCRVEIYKGDKWEKSTSHWRMPQDWFTRAMLDIDNIDFNCMELIKQVYRQT